MTDLTDVIVQYVRVVWTKRSRGAPGAAIRNAAPLGFSLPYLVRLR